MDTPPDSAVDTAPAGTGAAERGLPIGNRALARVLDHMLNGIAYCQVVTEEGRAVDWIYLYTNPAFHQQTGLGPLCGKRASEAIPGILAADPHLLEIYGRVAATGTSERFETFVSSLGGWFTVQVHSPEPGFFLAVFDVTTERVRHDADLHKVEERLALAQRASRSGIWDWDIPGGTLYWSDAFVELFGLDAAQMQPSLAAWRRAVHPDDLAAAEANVETALREWRPLMDEYRVVLPTGEIRWVRAYGNTIYAASGQPQRMIGLCIDVTEAKSLAAVAARADAASRAKSSFLATMSHELRTPLNSVIGFSTLMLDGLAGPVNDEQRTQLAIIQRSGQQLLELVSEFLDLAKVEAGQLAVANAPVDLGALVREQCDLMRLQATQRGLELEQPASASPIVVFADSKRLRQVIHNLVSNAIKFTDLGGIRIDVVVVDGHRARVSVHDTGIGIAPLDQSKLFVPFARVRAPGALERPGTGLGLAISRRLVEAMNGDIGVTSEPGRGSTFWFTVPLDADSLIAAPDCDVDPAFACLAATADITLVSATKD